MARKPFINRPHKLSPISQWGEQDIKEIVGVDTPDTLPLKIKNSRFRSVLELTSYAFANSRDHLVLCLGKEFSHRDIFAWVPVLLGLGIIAYFSLPREPDGFGLALISSVLMFLVWKLRKNHIQFLCSASVLLLVGGVVLAKLETERLSTPLLKQAGTFEISGRVTELVPGDKRTRVVLRGVRHLHQSPTIFAGVQLSAFNQHVQNLRIGDVVQVRARLEPMSGPLIPDGYDFRRVGYFKGLSARGFLLGEAVPFLRFSSDSGPSLTDRLNKMRLHISQRISESLPGQGGALAAALLVGQRAGISDEVQDALRSSGLAHILAISGLHMALITSLIFGVVRLFGAFSGSFSAQHDVKKIAAITALLGAVTYLALSGSAISAQRAFLMASVFLIAILFNRAALTMRNVAISALVILSVQPSAILTPGFQMSFMAVIALVAVYRRDGVFARLKRRFATRGVATGLLLGTLGLLLTSIVAGVATSPFAVHHFYQTAVYGVLGNLAAMPIVGLVVMPMGVLALMLMPFGLEEAPLFLMDIGLQYVVSISYWVSQIEGAVFVYGQQSALATLFISLGLLSVCLLRTRVKFYLAGILSVLAVLAVFGHTSDPLLLISPNGKMVADIQTDGLNFQSSSRNAFTAGIWMRAMGDERDVAAATSRGSGKDSCDATACSFSVETKIQSDVKVVIARRAEAWFEICRENPDILISALPVPRSCPGNKTFENVALFDLDTMSSRGAVRLDRIDTDTSTPIEYAPGLPKKLAALGLELRQAFPIHKRPWN